MPPTIRIEDLLAVTNGRLLNPTAVAQLKAVADAGEIMPQKTTYFFPKLASGLLIDPIDPGEEVTEGT